MSNDKNISDLLQQGFNKAAVEIETLSNLIITWGRDFTPNFENKIQSDKINDFDKKVEFWKKSGYWDKDSSDWQETFIKAVFGKLVGYEHITNYILNESIAELEGQLRKCNKSNQTSFLKNELNKSLDWFTSIEGNNYFKYRPLIEENLASLKEILYLSEGFRHPEDYIIEKYGDPSVNIDGFTNVSLNLGAWRLLEDNYLMSIIIKEVLALLEKTKNKYLESDLLTPPFKTNSPIFIDDGEILFYTIMVKSNSLIKGKLKGTCKVLYNLLKKESFGKINSEISANEFMDYITNNEAYPDTYKTRNGVIALESTAYNNSKRIFPTLERFFPKKDLEKALEF